MNFIDNIKTLFVAIGVLQILILPTPGYAATCPGSEMPKTVNAIYVKYKITDELEIKSNRKLGAPSSVQGSELSELIIWKDYVWKRLYGKYWGIDSEAEDKYQDNYTKTMEMLIEKQLQGEDVDRKIVDKLTIDYMNHKPKNKVYEYDRIRVKTPGYSLRYNRANKTGSGLIGRHLTKSDINNLDKQTKMQLDPWVSASFSDASKIFGLEKLTTKKSVILGHDVTCETVKTSFNDSQRRYGQLEVCKANISGVEIDLYKKMGEPGEYHITEAIEINKSYPIKKDVFCAPDYVKMRSS